MSDKWKVMNYDATGSDDDGWEINDAHEVGVLTLDGEEHFDDAAILERLHEMGFLNLSVTLDHLHFDGDDARVVIIDAEDGRPLFGLDREQLIW